MGLRDARAKVTRMISEMTKFDIMSHTTVFMSMKHLLDDFEGNNIEIFCVFLEYCGVFLYKKPETHQRVSNLASHDWAREATMMKGCMYA